MGKPGLLCRSSRARHEKRTWGSETSQYPVEKKPNSSHSHCVYSVDTVSVISGISLVAASETEGAQTELCLQSSGL